MWKYCSLLLIVLFAWGCNSQDSYGMFVDVSVYYESFCPDSIRFIVEQLFPVYKVIGQAINLKLIPYGFAKTLINHNGQYAFVCQHGPRECYGNLIESCAISLYDIEQSLSFIYCTMKGDPTSIDTQKQCANNTNIDWALIEKCYKSDESGKLLAANGNLTRQVQPPIKFIPTIVYYNEFNQTLQDQSLYDFGRIVCKLLNYEPRSCVKSNLGYEFLVV